MGQSVYAGGACPQDGWRQYERQLRCRDIHKRRRRIPDNVRSMATELTAGAARVSAPFFSTTRCSEQLHGEEPGTSICNDERHCIPRTSERECELQNRCAAGLGNTRYCDPICLAVGYRRVGTH